MERASEGLQDGFASTMDADASLGVELLELWNGDINGSLSEDVV
jgi:hypothetical protein